MGWEGDGVIPAHLLPLPVQPFNTDWVSCLQMDAATAAYAGSQESIRETSWLGTSVQLISNLHLSTQEGFATPQHPAACLLNGRRKDRVVLNKGFAFRKN